jgi:hypothetical protein
MLGAHFVFCSYERRGLPATRAVSQAWYRFRHIGKVNMTEYELKSDKVLFFSILLGLETGEGTGKLAEVPPVLRQFIDNTTIARQISGNFRSQFCVSQVANLHNPIC